MVDYPITTKDKIFTFIIIIGVLSYLYGQFTSSGYNSWFIEGGKILIYGGITIFLIERLIRIVKKK